MVYNIPETKPIMEPPAPKVQDEEAKPEPSEQQKIEKVLDNLKRLEIDEFPIMDVDAEKVKSLLGNLYMELLFPHNDQDTFMDMTINASTPLFDKKA